MRPSPPFQPKQPAEEATSSAAPARSPRTTSGDPLLAAICHDLRAPLAAVSMGANFVLQTTPEGEAAGRSRRVLQAIVRSCKQMERIIRDFGDLSEIEGGSVVLRMGLHDAAQMLELAAESARADGAGRSVVIAVAPPPEPILMHCDRDRLLRAFHHVFHNAVRHSPDGATVAASVREDDGNVSFDIVDQGQGLSDETLAHLYDRTWHSKRAERVGAGLGLAIVRGFVDAHDGHIDVDTRVGGPTRFRLTLPKNLPTKH